MSYIAGRALQASIYQHLRADTAVSGFVGDAIFDAMPVQTPSGVHIALGPEVTQDAGDISAQGAVHEIELSVLEGRETGGGFAAVKDVAAAVSGALESADLVLDKGHLVGIWLLRTRARRVENGGARRVDLTFRARIDLG